MKLLAILRKALREQRRDLLLLSLTLIFGPFCVLLYRTWFPSGSTTYGVLVLDLAGEGQPVAAVQVVDVLQSVRYANGNPMLKVRLEDDRTRAEALLRDRQVAALLILPADLAAALDSDRQAAAQPPGRATLTLVGDLTNPSYAVAAILVAAAMDGYVEAASGEQRSITWAEEPLGASAARSEFENYVPGLLIFATMMLMFPAAMTIVREVETGTLRRLQMAGVTSGEFLGGASLALILFGVLSVILTLLAAWALGFRSQGPIGLAVVVGAITCVSVVGVGLIVAGLSRTAMQAFLIANFPLAMFMFFSGAMFPVPRVPLFAVGGRSIGLYDILPPTHAVVALNKVLTLGSGPADVVFELAALLILSALYFTVGVWLFKRTHLRL